MTPSRPSTLPPPPRMPCTDWTKSDGERGRCHVVSTSRAGAQRQSKGDMRATYRYLRFSRSSKAPLGILRIWLLLRSLRGKEGKQTNKQTNVFIITTGSLFLAKRGTFKNLTQGKGITPHDLHTFEFPEQKYPDGLLWSHVVRLLQKIHFGGADCNQTLGFCVCWVAAFRRTSGDVQEIIYLHLLFFRQTDKKKEKNLQRILGTLLFSLLQGWACQDIKLSAFWMADWINFKN